MPHHLSYKRSDFDVKIDKEMCNTSVIMKITTGMKTKAKYENIPTLYFL